MTKTEPIQASVHARNAARPAACSRGSAQAPLAAELLSSAGPDQSMRFAICNEMFAGWSLEKTCALVRQWGYDGLELAPHTLTSNVSTWPAAARAEVSQTIRQAGLQTIGLHWLLAGKSDLHLTSPQPEVRRRTAAYLTDLARLCRDLDGRVLVLGSPQQRRLLPGVSHQDGMRFATEVVEATFPALEACDVTLAIEPLAPSECNFLTTAAEAVSWLTQMGNPRVRLHLDARAMSSEPQPIPAIILQSAGSIAHFHANDPNLLGPGMGPLDFAPILKALRQAGYDAWISVEVFATGPGPEQIARESIQYLTRINAEIECQCQDRS